MHVLAIHWNVEGQMVHFYSSCVLCGNMAQLFLEAINFHRGFLAINKCYRCASVGNFLSHRRKPRPKYICHRDIWTGCIFWFYHLRWPQRNIFHVSQRNYTLFLLAMLFLAQAQMLLSEFQNSLKLALPYLTKRCFKYYLGR